MATTNSADKIMERLREPFRDDEIEWRPLRIGKSNNGTRAWVLLAPFVQARAIMNRLDDVVGIGSWQDDYRELQTPNGAGCVCHLSVKIEGDWITKTDGADFTDIENTKGGISDALKRAAVKFGIGRYLYTLESHFADVQDGKPPKNVRAVRIDDRKQGVKGWVPCPSLNGDPPPTGDTTGPERPEDDGRGVVVQYIVTNEPKVYGSVHARHNARNKWAGAKELDAVESVDDLKKYANHIHEKIQEKKEKAA